MTQLTSTSKCAQKTTYARYNTARNAVRRRNKAAGVKYLRAYKCNECTLWHATTQVKEQPNEH